MKRALLVVALALVAAPALAEEGQVSKSALNSLGLSGMQQISDEAGMQVRGRASLDAAVKGTSLLFFQLLTPDTKNFLIGSSVNEVDGDLVDPAVTIGTDVVLSKSHNVGVAGNLAVNYAIGTDTLIYSGIVSGQAGGIGSITLLFP